MAMTLAIMLACLRHGPRLRPSFASAGFGKCGSTTLYVALAGHPQVALPATKEIDYFGTHFKRGRRWYARQFPFRWQAGCADAITGDLTPAYGGARTIPGRMYRHFGDSVKLIAIMRDPAARAWSHYWNRRRIGAETRGFEEALGVVAEARASGDWDHYLRDGRYVPKLNRFLRVFPRSALHAMFLEELVDDPGAEFNRLADFLGIARDRMRLPHANAGGQPPLPDEVRARLHAHYAADDAALAALLGRTLPWR
jgi:hypothetical protein